MSNSSLPSMKINGKKTMDRMRLTHNRNMHKTTLNEQIIHKFDAYRQPIIRSYPQRPKTRTPQTRPGSKIGYIKTNKKLHVSHDR